MFKFIRLGKSIIIAIVGCGLFLSFACDGAIRVKGKVYARKASKGSSEAFVDESSPDSSPLTPVKDAQVTLYHGGDYSQQSINKSTLWKDTGKTDASGAFELGGTTAPHRFHAALVVEKEGYRSLTKIFLHDKVAPHEAVIILEPNEAVAKWANSLAPAAENKRLERTRHERASLLSCVGEPLNRSVRCFVNHFCGRVLLRWVLQRKRLKLY